MTQELEPFLQAMDLGNREAVDSLINQILEAVTLRVEKLLDAERASIFLVDSHRDTIYARLAHGEDGKPLRIEFPIGVGIAGRVARTGEVLNIRDAYRHPDFNPQIDRETGYHTRNMLCMPVFDRKKYVLAAVQLLNKRTGDGFTFQDEQAFKDFAEPLGLILESSLRMRR